MKGVVAIIVKFVGSLLVSWVAFSILNNINGVTIIIVSAAVTVVNYVVGDVLVLSRLGNFITSAVNGILGAIVASTIIVLTTTQVITTASIVLFTFMIIAFELIFHVYLLRSKIVDRVNVDSNILINKSVNYNTEMADELNPYNKRDIGVDNRNDE